MAENSEIAKKKNLRLKSSQSKNKKITQKGTRIRVITDLNKARRQYIISLKTVISE